MKQVSRRRVLRDGLGLACAGSLAMNGLVADEKQDPGASVVAPNYTVSEVRTISHQESLYHGWPTLIRRGNGELLVVCSGGRERHVCPFGRVEMIRSLDEGTTWSSAQIILDGPIDDRDAGLLETAEGTLLTTTFTSLAYEPILKKAEAAAADGKPTMPADRLARWQAAHAQAGDSGHEKMLGTWMCRSTDGGMSWSAPYDCVVDSPHGPIQLADGRILYAGVELWTKDRRVGAAVSEDDGVSWQWLSQIPVRDGDEHRNYHELHAVECVDGRIVAQIRNHNTANKNETLQTHSTDGGWTWAKPYSIGVWGMPSHLLRLSDDRLLMTYGYRRNPLGNQARISEDNGQTWSPAMQIYGDGPSSDLGYPSTVEISPGNLLSVWYERPASSPFAQLRMARWQLNS